MKVLVCGCRDFNNPRFVYKTLDNVFNVLISKGVDITIIHGAAKGIDSMASVWASTLSLTQDIFPAQWSKYGKAAGPVRNKKMLEEGKPDSCIAFWDLKSKGTKDMINKCLESGIKVEIIPINNHYL